MATLKLSPSPSSSSSSSSTQPKLSAASFIPNAARAFNATPSPSKSRFLGKCLKAKHRIIQRASRSGGIIWSASSSPANLPYALLFDCYGVLVDTEKDGHMISFNDTFKEVTFLPYFFLFLGDLQYWVLVILAERFGCYMGCWFVRRATENRWWERKVSILMKFQFSPVRMKFE